mmetsp:Transcript_9543/g.14042  ORF Transcript_9543/g.14042 Transcript_9543/m.14042 type:complete len:308 (+) Transcript_9543:128-1051(+)|eukprot:CAMPEP_0197232612 /NCGR_PEP_ID=MMETSP1429-20130617/869_1 /TAXON_ID=49237 /ORGANISM="Chaetoceros  sp., Strain UNC1202" /LENGTH=307 /DNA_ID=CAMNT_0042690687 /DNA_START=95 /DNA_END=1018 /DNA_ORIENTATION=-
MKLPSIFTFPALTLLICSLHSASADQTDQASPASSSSTEVLKTYKIYHSLHSNDIFTPRGTIELSTLTTTTENEKETSTEIVASVQQEENCLANAAEEIDGLVTSGNFYRIKVVDEDTGKSALSSVPACDFRRSNFREEISLSIGHTGSLISVSYKPIVSPLARPCSELPPMTSASNTEFIFQTTVKYTTATPGMTIPVIMPATRPPNGFGWIKRKSRPEVAGGTGTNAAGTGGDPNSFDPNAEGENEEHHSFFRRYWYIILPVTVMTFFGSEEPAPEAAQSAGAAAVTAAASATGSAPKQRRGKRN